MNRAQGDLELTICALALVVSTLGFLLAAYALIVIGLVCGGVSLGLRLGTRRAARNSWPRGGDRTPKPKVQRDREGTKNTENLT